MANRYAVKSLKATFGTSAFACRTAPAGDGVSCDPTDVTCLVDTEEIYIPGAIKKHDEITLKVNGMTDAPELNTVADLTLEITFNDGSTDTSKTITIANCILKAVKPSSIDAGGDRAADYELTFQPGGTAA